MKNHEVWRASSLGKGGNKISKLGFFQEATSSVDILNVTICSGQGFMDTGLGGCHRFSCISG
ncbi:MAG: hypothetical protein VST68_02460, partial [Nitrospirota bacterium]|nr:hypothetical protein [Nitrospirota bacterium]